jgi:CSLREA domain-containing protein
MRELLKITLLCGFFVLLTNASLHAQSTYTVNTTIDAPDAAPGDGVCADGNGNCTLRAAIEEANANMGTHDLIHFNIPGGGLQTILPGMLLPSLTDNAGVTIDGTTQPGATIGANPPATANLMIEIKGNSALPPPVHGFWVLSDNNDIRGLIINEFSGDGVRIEGTPSSTDNNLVYANFIGTDQSGTTDLGNANASSTNSWWAGVNIIVPPCDILPVFAMNNIVRRNLISGNGATPTSVNRGEGVSITNCPPGDNGFNLVEYNYIGTDINGTSALGNDSDGVTIAEAAHDNTIDNNLISGNGFSGVGINGLSVPPRFTSNNTVSNNIIGLDITGTNAIPNGFQGVSIGMYGPNTWGYAPTNSGITNTIGRNTGNGILVAEFNPPGTNCDGNLISQNSIFSNGGLGIDLVSIVGTTGVVTLNDPMDPDNGPNQECNFPIILSATISGVNTTITGTVNFPNPASGTVEVFRASPDPSGYGEGITWLDNATPDASGFWTLVTTKTITTNDVLTATSTDVNNNTSEFSGNFTNITTGISSLVDDFEFSIFPNPTNDIATVIIANLKGGEAHLELINSSGIKLKYIELEETVSNITIEIDLKDYTPGLYWIKLSNDKASKIEKLILIR